ncbi:hypothetical protein BH23ACT11_BH23ACT11_18020 [soil metagenome]
MSELRMDEVLEEHIGRQVALLGHEDKLRVLDFVRALAVSGRPRGVSGEELLRRAGTIPEGELERLSETVRKERERQVRESGPGG